MKAEFKGRPLIEIPIAVPQIGFLEGDFGEEFLKEYSGRVKADYGNNKNLRVLNQNDDLVTGSNPFAVVLANQVLAEEGLRTAKQADLEKALKLGAFNLRGTYEDTGLVLRSEADPNKYLAGDLARQLRVRNPQTQYPALVNLADLTLRADSASEHGLAFQLKDSANPIYVPILNQQGNFSSFDIDEFTGLPKQTRSGNRTLYTRSAGLSRLFLSRGLYLDSNDGGLAGSNSDGRVVVVSGE